MRTMLGRTPVVLARRWLALERLAAITLRRDAYAEPPGPTLGLSIGERTSYRPAAWLLDTFERAALGGSYPAWGGSGGLTLDAGRVVPVVVGPPGMVTHVSALPRDPWAAVVIGALAGDAAVGVLTRAAAESADGYRITATPSATIVERLDAGVATTLASEPTAWRPGETLRVVWAWDRCRVYRDAIVVLELSDAARLTDGRAGLVVTRGDADADAAIASFVAGAARHEYLGAGLDLGDVQLVIGQPASFDVTLANLAPMGGAARFAALLRYGRNDEGTYDLDRGTVRVLTVVDGAPAPLTAGVGLIDGPAEVAEDRVRLIVRGRDAFLTPKIRPGPVAYLAGPPPGGLTPMPTDPCEPSAPPMIVVGPVPPEPETPPGDDGIGPENPPGPTPPPPPLMGHFIVTFGYAGFGTDGQELVYATAVTEYVNAAPPDVPGLPPGRGSVPVWDRRQRDRDDDNPEKDGQPPTDLNEPLPPWSPGQPIPAGMGMWINTLTDDHGAEYTTATPCVCGACDSPGEIPVPPGHTYLGSCFAGGCGSGPTPGSRCDPDATTLVLPRSPSPGLRTDEARPYARHYRWLYRGPDVVGTHLSRDGDDASTESLLFEEWWTIAPLDYDNSATTYGSREIKLALYDAGAIHSTADLLAIGPFNKPRRIETLATWTINGGAYSFKTASAYFAKVLALTALPLNAFAGPQLIAIELPDVGWSNGALPRSEVAVWPYVNRSTRLLKVRAL